MSQRDRDDIIFGHQQGFDFIAASFVRTAQDVYDIRNLLNEYDSHIRIIAKVENREGVNNIDSILAAAGAVMVARGDLGVEIDFTELPGIQKSVIDRSFSLWQAHHHRYPDAGQHDRQPPPHPCRDLGRCKRYL